MTRVAQITHVLLRIVAGLLFMQHGGQKLLGWFGGIGAPGGGSVPLSSLMGVAGIIEFWGGLALLLGLLTRFVGFVMAGEMAVAYFLQHFPHGNWPIQNHGEPAVLYAFIFLFFAGNGSGGFSLDSLIFRRRREARVHDDRAPDMRPRIA
ncbi:MAG: DoxX family protein [Candidatus Eisenbacteria bacterium]|uniref:DoxX family protein n=1 Tax=Eiseniibacteriota bacterium TaxID=2212470 RepID=A0A538U7P6_UNCEI|nr:MAG: DoxX family protein [Candidatus Eisenbacteria bacterium]